MNKINVNLLELPTFPPVISENWGWWTVNATVTSRFKLFVLLIQYRLSLQTVMSCRIWIYTSVRTVASVASRNALQCRTSRPPSCPTISASSWLCLVPIRLPAFLSFEVAEQGKRSYFIEDITAIVHAGLGIMFVDWVILRYFTVTWDFLQLHSDCLYSYAA